MRTNVIRVVCVFAFVALCCFAASAQEILKEKAYQIRVQPGWTRTEHVPQGLDVGFRKKMADGDYATFYFHHEVMPAEAGEPPSDTSYMKRQWDAMLRNQYPDVRSVAGAVPKVSGKILVNGTYELTDDGKKMRRRYTYFLGGRTAFVVQCSAPPPQWQIALSDFDIMLVSLQPGGSSPKAETKSDESAKVEIKRGLPILLESIPAQWTCSVSDVSITPGTPTAKRTLEIGLSFDRSDIGDIYKATKLLFGMMKTGKTDADLKNIPSTLQSAALRSDEFIEYVGQVWGYAGGYVAASCDPPIERYKVSIIGSSGARIGSISISREDGSAILSGKVTTSDVERVAGMYVFE